MPFSRTQNILQKLWCMYTYLLHIKVQKMFKYYDKRAIKKKKNCSDHCTTARWRPRGEPSLRQSSVVFRVFYAWNRNHRGSGLMSHTPDCQLNSVFWYDTECLLYYFVIPWCSCPGAMFDPAFISKATEHWSRKIKTRDFKS